MGVRGEFLITASSVGASAPTYPVAADSASVFVVFQETVNVPLSGIGAAQGDASASGLLKASAAGIGSAIGEGYAGKVGPFDYGTFE
jgi:hypothetical protein